MSLFYAENPFENCTFIDTVLYRLALYTNKRLKCMSMRKILLLLCTILLSCLQTVVAQNKQVSGTVTSVDGEPLIGVTVVVKELGTGTSTDIDGHYSIEAPAQGTLKFSFVGMRTVETPINNRSTIDVTMEEEAVLADEVIVTGYAATRKAAFTGSAQVVDSKLISRQTDANFMKALEGSVLQVCRCSTSTDSLVDLPV